MYDCKQLNCILRSSKIYRILFYFDKPLIFAFDKYVHMKKSLFILCSIPLVMFLIFNGCKKKPTPQPCDNTGQICITNKLTSVATIQVVQQNNVFQLDKDFMKCLTVPGDNPYTFKITCENFYLDTTIMILTCDDLQLILE